METQEFFESVQKNMMVIIIDHCMIILNGVLKKLTRFDENKLFSSILVLTVSKEFIYEIYCYSVYLSYDLYAKQHQLRFVYKMTRLLVIGHFVIHL